jgi:uncharacterized protein (DUF1501 family)
MSDTTVTTDAAAETSGDSATPAETATVEAPAAPEVRDSAKLLSAYEAEKGKRKEQDAALRDLRAELDAIKAKAEGKEVEYQAEQARRETERAALDKANDRIRKSEVKAAAKGVLADPQDAYKFLDLDSFEVDDDGNVDEGAIAKALADLVEEKPYLSAQGGKRFQGTADGGARNDATKPSQLTESDLDRMSAEQIEGARKEGRLNNLLGIKT